jgi:hypothetical protein
MQEQPTEAPVSHTPTAEQAAIVAAFRTGAGLVIEAGAGTGKTSTLKFLAAAKPNDRGLYIAYNRAIADDAKRSFPASVFCSTAHGLAYRAIGGQYRHRLNAGRIPARETARILGIHGPTKIGDVNLAPEQVARLAMEMVSRFCKSADREIDRWHTPRKPALSDPATLAELAAVLAPLARKAWADLISRDGRLHFTHDVYLKLWQLSGPRLGSDYILLDEAQDCQPPGTIVDTPGGPVKIEDLHPGARVISYTRSGLRLRMRGSVISRISPKQHNGVLVKVATASGLETSYTPGHICIAKIGPAFAGKTLLYLMKRGQSWRVGVTSAYHGKNRPSSGVAGRLREEDADAIWVLAAFSDKRDALMAEAAIPAKYGIPEMRFRDNGQQTMGQDRLDAFWHDMGDLTRAARNVLTAFDRDIRHPLAKRSFTEAGDRMDYLLYTRAATVRACNLMDGMQVLDARSLSERPSQRARRSDDAWTAITVSRVVYNGPVWSMDVEGDHTYIGDGIATHNCNPVVLSVVTQQAGSQLIAVGDRSQAIYGWNGAVDAMTKFPADQRLHLSQSFRFGSQIAREANKWLSILGADLRLRGYDRISSQVCPCPNADAVLCRTNAEAMSQAMHSLEAGHRTAVVGGGREIRALAEAAIMLKAGAGCNHPELFAFTTWAEVQDYAEHDPGGSDLKVLVKLIDDHGPDVVIEMVDNLCDERDAHTIVSTAHKAKGREWDSVRIASDFREPAKDPEKPDADPEVPAEQAMLAYVAVTRARLTLDREGLAWVDKYLPTGA